MNRYNHLEYFIIGAILSVCVLISIVAGVWCDHQGWHPMLSWGVGLTSFFICVGVILIFIMMTGIGISIIDKMLKKKSIIGETAANITKDVVEEVKVESILKQKSDLPKSPDTIKEESTITAHGIETATEIGIEPEKVTTKFEEQNSTKLELELSNKNHTQRQLEFKNRLKELFKYIIERASPKLDTKEDAVNLFNSICIYIDEETIDTGKIVEIGKGALSNEDIYHIGFILKYYLKKENDFGATFIYKVFTRSFKKEPTVEYEIVKSKLASNEKSSHIIELPPSCFRENSNKKTKAEDGDLEKDLQRIKEESKEKDS